MSDFVISPNCEGVLMKILEAWMQQGVATSLTTTEAPCYVDLFIVEGYATTILRPICTNRSEPLIKEGF